MNVIFLKFSLPYNIPLLINMVKELGIKNLYFIGSKTGCPNKEELANLGCNLFLFEEHDLFNALFTNVDWNSMIPIDKPLLENMSLWESEILRLFERDHQIINEDDKAWFDEDYYNTKILMRAQNYSSFINHVEYNGEEKRRKYYRYLRYWNHFLTTNKIDFTVSAFYPHFPYEYILYRLCKIKSIPTILTCHTPIPGKWLVYDELENPVKDLLNIPPTTKTEDELISSLSNMAQIEINRIKNEIQPYYMQKGYVDNLLKNDPMDRVVKDNERIRKLRPERNKNKKRYNLFNEVSRALLIDKIHFKIRHRNRKQIGNILQKYYEKKCETHPDLKVNYIYLALHYQPEASNSPIGGYYANQALIAQMITHYLPEGWFLYLKEHPAQQFINRSLEFYNDLFNNPKIKLISKSFSSFDLSKSSKAVATIAGTIAWESLFNQKPVLMFGASPIMYAPGVYSIKNNSDIKSAIEEIIGGKLASKLDILNYVKHLDDSTVLAVNDYIQKKQYGYTDEEYVERMTPYYVNFIKSKITK